MGKEKKRKVANEVSMHHIGFNIDRGGMNYPEILSLSKLSETLGYDSICLYDHLYSLGKEDELCLEAWSLLSAISIHTSRAKLLPLVTNNLFRHPGVLAKMASTVDNLSKGRLIFGIGAGWYEKEALDFGYAFPDLRTRFEMLDESIQVISKLWKEEKTTFKGKHYNLLDAESLPKPFQKPHPPILVGGKARGVLEITAKYADMCNFTLRGLGPQKCEKLLCLLKEYCKAVGRDYNSILKTISGPCFFANTEQELQRELEAEAKRQGGGKTKEELVEYYRSSALFGTFDEVIDQVREYERIGVEGIMVRFDRSAQAEKAELFSKNILPRIRS